MLFGFWVLSYATALAKVLILPCNSDSDCSEQYVCHESICKKCLNCNLLFRKGNSCVVDFNDCGQCLNGYEEISVTDYSVILKPCKLIKIKEELKKCTDNSCPPNNYCNEQICVKCFDCSLFNRLHPIQKCARSLHECSSCINGYSEVAVTIDTNIKLCEINNLGIQENSLKILSSNAATSILVVAFVLTLFFIYITIKIIKRAQEGNLPKIITPEHPIYPSAPPFFAIESPKQIKKHKTDATPALSGIEICRRICKEDIQQAKVFKQPSASYYYLEQDENILELRRKINGIFLEPKDDPIARTPEELNHNLHDGNVDESVVPFPSPDNNQVGSHSSNAESVTLGADEETQSVNSSVNEETATVTFHSKFTQQET